MLTSARQIEGTPQPTYKVGRRCRDCGCYLSRYNRRLRYWACRPERRTLAPLDKQPAREQFLDALREIMEEA
jgi:hypothetical protein